MSALSILVSSKHLTTLFHKFTEGSATNKILKYRFGIYLKPLYIFGARKLDQ